MDANGWLHRKAYVINAMNGNVYSVIINIAKTTDGRTILYATKGKIKKVGQTNVNSLKIKGSRSYSNSMGSITDVDENVKKNSFSDIDAEITKSAKNTSVLLTAGKRRDIFLLTERNWISRVNTTALPEVTEQLITEKSLRFMTSRRRMK